MGVPIILGREGVEKIVDIHLSAKEAIAFKSSVGHIKERTEALLAKRQLV